MSYLFLAGQTLVGISLAYHAATVAAAFRWRERSRQIKAMGAAHLPDWPGVTILKPLCGIDPHHDANLRSFCNLDYPHYQIIFGALDADDPGLETAYVLGKQFRASDITIISGGEVLGENRKVSNLLAMMPDAKHDILVIADSDMRVQPDYLRAVIAPFGDPNIGLVTCPYRGADPAGLAGGLEALGIGAEFMPSAFLAYYAFKLRFAFGSTIAIRRGVLDQIGGFEGLLNVLADDFMLADRAHRAGHKVHLSSYVVDDSLGRESFATVWKRRLRWARTSRAMRPGPYMGLFIAYLTPLALLAFALNPAGALAWELLVCAIVLRIAFAGIIASRCTHDLAVVRRLALLPIAEVVSGSIWLTSLFGSTVHWRGKAFAINRDGTLTGRSPDGRSGQ